MSSSFLWRSCSQLGRVSGAPLCLGTPALAVAFDVFVSLSATQLGTGSQLAGLRLHRSPPSPKTYLIFSFKVVLATPRRCSAGCLGRVGCVSFPPLTSAFSPLIPPLGPKRVQALPAPISVNSLLSPRVAARCRANVTPDSRCLPPPSSPGWWESAPLGQVPGKGPLPAESPRSSHVGVLRWQLSPCRNG